MIESLRIKCPSCGIFLEVKNSKNEAVKRICCPNCKKPLAVNFEEEDSQPKTNTPQSPLGTFYYGVMCLKLQEGVNQLPLEGNQFIEVKAVRLADGHSKCIVKALTAEHTVKVNDQPLLKDDEVVLAVGDEIQLDDIVLSFGKKRKDTKNTTSPTPTPTVSPKPSLRWPYLALAFLFVLGLAIWKLWPEEKVALPPEKKATKVVTPRKDTIKSDKKGKTTVLNPIRPSTSLANLSDVELELKAKNNVDAQYEFGKRKVKRGDSTSIVIGVNYLKLATKNGSSEARFALQKVYESLERKASSGNSHASNLLEVIK